MQDQSFEDKKCIEICANFEYVDGNKSVFPIFTMLTAIDYYPLWRYDNFINMYHLMHCPFPLSFIQSHMGIMWIEQKDIWTKYK